MLPELRNRLVFGVALALLVVGGIVHDLLRPGHLGVLALCILLAVLAAREFVRLARSVAPGLGVPPVAAVAVALVVEAWIQAALPGGGRLAALPVPACILALGLAWVALEQLHRRGIEAVFAHLGAAVLGMLYVGLPFALIMRLAGLAGPPELGGAQRGGLLLVAFLATVKLGDVAAYFGGRALGRRKMCPGISPGKTWEGFACSFAGAVGGSYLVAAICAAAGHSPFAGWWQPAVWGLVLGPLGAVGDLVESCFKRAAAVKDSGGSLPGFGGVLDLYDAVVLAAPVAFLLALAL